VTDQDIIRKAVEIADGWELASRPTHWRGHGQLSWTTREMRKYELDALAAQLVRQLYIADPERMPYPYHADPMETITDIIDSKVLENE